MIKKIKFLLIFIIGFHPLFSQEVFFVSVDGDDQNSGILTSPWQNIQYAVDQLSTGDSLYLLGGVYYEKLSVNRSGSKISPIVIAAYKGQNVVIDVEVNNSDDPIISISGQKYIHIKNLEIRNNTFGSNSSGINIKDSEHIHIENCILHSNHYGIRIMDGDESSSSNIIIRNNLIHSNIGPGLKIAYLNGKTDVEIIYRLSLLNNTFFHNGMQEDDPGEIILSSCVECLVSNNVFYLLPNAFFGSVNAESEELEMKYNAFYSIGGKEEFKVVINGEERNDFEDIIQSFPFNEKNYFENPLFIDESSSPPNFHLTPNSPLINKGDVDFIAEENEKDIDGQQRVNQNRVDIGADEYHINLIVCSLGFFTAEVKEDLIELNWSGTCFSENGGKYKVLRSRDAEKWDTIGEVLSQLDLLNSEVFYHFKDEYPLEGINYYKVRFIDENGSFNDTNPDVVKFSRTGFLVYPNPVKDQVRIIVEKPNDSYYTIFDHGAKRVQAGKIEDQIIEVGQLNSGVYLLLIHNGDGQLIFQQRLLVMH